MAERTVTCSRCGQTLHHPFEICGICEYAQLDRLSRRFWRSLAAGGLGFGVGSVLLIVGMSGRMSWPFLGLFLALAAMGSYWIIQALGWWERRKTAAKVNMSSSAGAGTHSLAQTITPLSRDAVDMFDGTVGLGEGVRLLQDFFARTGYVIEEEAVTNGMLFSGSKEFGDVERPRLACYEVKIVIRSVRLQPVSVQAEIRETYVPTWDGYYARHKQYYHAWLGVLRTILTPPDLPVLSANGKVDRSLNKRLREKALANNPHMEVLARAHARELVQCPLCSGKVMAGARDCCCCGQPIAESGSRLVFFTGYFDWLRRLKQP